MGIVARIASNDCRLEADSHTPSKSRAKDIHELRATYVTLQTQQVRYFTSSLGVGARKTYTMLAWWEALRLIVDWRRELQDR